MTEAMPFLQKFDITFLRPPTILAGFRVFADNGYGCCGRISRVYKRSGRFFRSGCCGCGDCRNFRLRNKGRIRTRLLCGLAAASRKSEGRTERDCSSECCGKCALCMGAEGVNHVFFHF